MGNPVCQYKTRNIILKKSIRLGCSLGLVYHSCPGAGAILFLNNYNGAGALITYIFNRTQSKNFKASCHSIPKTYIFLKLKITSSKIELTLTLGS